MHFHTLSASQAPPHDTPRTLWSWWRQCTAGVLVAAGAVLPALAQTPGTPMMAATATPVTSAIVSVQPLTDPSATPGATGTSAGGYSAAARTPGLDPEAKSDAVPATIDADYKIGPNDLLEVEVFGVSELKRTVRVNSTGQISMPLIGLAQVAGMTASDAEALIALMYSKNYLQDPQVSIFIKEFTSQRITVDGAVIRPGIYPLIGQITLLRALAMAGGGSQLSDLEQVMLFRVTPSGQNLVEKHDVSKIRTGDAPDPMLRGDDIVVVNRNGARTILRDSLFRDIIDTLNPFSASYRNAVAN